MTKKGDMLSVSFYTLIRLYNLKFVNDFHQLFSQTDGVAL